MERSMFYERAQNSNVREKVVKTVSMPLHGKVKNTVHKAAQQLQIIIGELSHRKQEKKYDLLSLVGHIRIDQKHRRNMVSVQIRHAVKGSFLKIGVLWIDRTNSAVRRVQ